MPKYYCDYCRSYLTHDSMSVRKSHLMGKNHIRYYCDYYEEQAKELNIWDQSELPYDVTIDDLYKGIPQSQTLLKIEKDEITEEKEDNIIIRNSFIPPPPPLTNMPNPPPAIYHIDSKEQRSMITDYIKEYQDRYKV